MPDLNNAIQLIRQGQKDEGQRMLEAVIKAEPGNIQAWFWYVETCPTVERRIQVLETCLRINPGNMQVTQALQALKNIAPASPKLADAQLPPSPHQPIYPAYEKQQPDYLGSPPPSSYYEEEKPQTPSQYNESSYVATPSMPAPAAQRKPWELDESAYVDHSMLAKSNPQPEPRFHTFYDVWMTVMLTQEVEAYAEVLRDPKAGLERAFIWMACVGVVNALTFPLIILLNPRFAELMVDPEFQTVLENVNLTALVTFGTVIMLFLMPIYAVAGLAISGAIQNFVARLFGGNGYYGRTVYALAAYLAPMTIISSLLLIVPVVGQCLGSVLSFYGLVLNVRALRASHEISTGSAIGVLLAPSVLAMIFACLFIVIGVLPGLGAQQ